MNDITTWIDECAKQMDAAVREFAKKVALPHREPSVECVPVDLTEIPREHREKIRPRRIVSTEYVIDIAQLQVCSQSFQDWLNVSTDAVYNELEGFIVTQQPDSIQEIDAFKLYATRDNFMLTFVVSGCYTHSVKIPA